MQETLRRVVDLSINPLKDQQIKLAFIGRLASLHQAVLQQLRQDPDANYSQMTYWSIDTDQLMHACNLPNNAALRQKHSAKASKNQANPIATSRDLMAVVYSAEFTFFAAGLRRSAQTCASQISIFYL